jgi:mono/diheme cytochrome c family protein/glucose/arabinose dehydrogenase
VFEREPVFGMFAPVREASPRARCGKPVLSGTPRRRVGLFLAALALAGLGLAAPSEKESWPPAVVPEDEGAPALSAEESMKTIRVPPGYLVELVAKEPLVVDPILIDFDADGRMWVVEMPAFAADEAMRDTRDPICRVVVLEDVDDDGVMDRRTVFADGLVLPRAIKTLAAGVLVGEPPNLWRMRDTDGDLKMDEKELISDRFGTREANPEHNANSLIWGLDNWIYTSEHDAHLRFRNGRFEVMETLRRGQWGGSIDDAGRVYRNVNSAPLFVDYTPARYFQRNPNLVRTRGLYEPLISLEDALVWPIRPTRGVNRGYRDQFFRPDGSSKILQSAATPVVYRGDRLPRELQGGVFVTDCTTNLLHWFSISEDDVSGITARNGFDRGEIFASSDERLRPVSAASAPDGTLYVVDMYRGVVQDVTYQTEYLRDYIRGNQLVGPVHLGRIWRIVHQGAERGRKPSLSKLSAAALVPYLSHPNGWWRDTAQQLLVQRGDKSVAPALRRLVREAADWRPKLHALGTLDGLGVLDPATLLPLLSDPSAEVRAWAIRWSEPWLAQTNHPLATAVLRRIEDPSVGVRRQLAASIGELPAPARLSPSLTMLRRYGKDPLTVDAVLSGLRGLQTTALQRLLEPGARTDDEDALAMLAGAVAHSGDVQAILSVLEWTTATPRATGTRLALLHGLEAGLDGARLPDEPRALTRLAAGSDETASAARAVAARLEWPGKPSASAEVRALTVEESARFASGKKLYGTLCVGCHQPDGRGREGTAPSLVGSHRVGADVAVSARIVLAGMEGELGLMPPLGTLTDAEIAAVLTYVRREWGNAADPVGPEEVREIRGLTRPHSRPWTAHELEEAEATAALARPSRRGRP